MSTETAVGISLSKLGLRQEGVIVRLDLPEPDARRLMELGFLPGSTVSRQRRAPLGGPDVFRIDDADIALREETAVRIWVRPAE